VEPSYIEVITAPTDLDKVRRALADNGTKIVNAELSMVPKNSLPMEDKAAASALKLLDILEDLDDVQKVYSNGDFPEAVLMEYAAGL
jgi:transcriptional/translational regulatory protein YebC/TACO1